MATGDKLVNLDDLKEVYDNIDGEVGSLKSAINAQVITVEGKNLINPNTLVVGRMKSDGTVQELSSYKTSDYILAEPGSYALGRVDVSNGDVLAPDYLGYGLYNLDKTFIADSLVYQQYTDPTTISITIQNKCYIRVTGNSAYFETYNTVRAGIFMLCKGTQLGDWKAYVNTELYGALVPECVDNVLIAVPGKNLYDKNACKPQNGYYYNSGNGQLASGENYAITGKIPVKENTQYVFSAGNVTISRVVYYSGDGGYIYLDKLSSPGAFTTPAGCTYVGFTLFAASHTTEDYNNAINAAQLELGDTVTTYEPYAISRVYTVPAVSGDVGKALVAKKVQNNRVEAWELVDPSGMIETDSTFTNEGEAADAKAVGDVVNSIMPFTPSKNLYNPTESNPVNGKIYNNSWSYVDSASYAMTGKIPVEAETTYTFTVKRKCQVVNVYYWGGETGTTKLSSEELSNVLEDSTFTTPENCTYIEISLFAVSHTTDQYNNVIACAQLEQGNKATDYVPYSNNRLVKTESLKDGDILGGAKGYTVFGSLVNLYDKNLAVDGKYWNGGQSAYYSNEQYAFSGLVPVEPNTHYNVSKDETVTPGSLGSYYQEWTESGVFIQESQQIANYNNIFQVQTGATTRFISFNIAFGSGSHTEEQFTAVINSIMMCEGTQRPLEYVPYKKEALVDNSKQANAYQNNDDCFRGKKWLICGTSVSYQDSKYYTEGVAEGELVRGYIGNVARHKRMLITNQAISGSTLADTTQSTALINRYQDLDFASYDFITLEYGINDYGRNVPVGTANDAAGTSTFAACLRTVIEYALAQNPIVGLIICTEPNVRDSANSSGNTLEDYTDVTLAIAKQYSLPVCDWYHYGGFNTTSRGDGSSRYALTQAGTHPSVYGHMRMGAMLNQVFDSLLC